MNPELQRNLWLEAQPRQLMTAGVVLCLVFTAVWLVDRGRSASAFVTFGALVFTGAALVWAPRLARASVTHEVYARTWDLQRLTSISPWTMTWGKLAGSTSRAWLFAGVGLAIGLLQLASITSVTGAAFWLLISVGLASLLQAAGMSVGLIEIRKARVLGRAPAGRSPALWLLALALMAAACVVSAQSHAVWKADVGAGLLTSARRPVLWWGHAYAADPFAAVTLVVFAAWAVLWAWRLMRLELQMQNVSWAWPLFVCTAALYAAGFQWRATLDGDLVHRLRQAALVCAGCAYVGSFIDPADRVQARQFGAALRRFDLGQLLRGTPLVLAPAKLAALAGVLLSVLDWRGGGGAAAVLDLALLAFFLRDLGLIAALRFAPRGRRGDLGVLLALLMLYVVGGLFASGLAGSRGSALVFANMEHRALSLWAGLVEAGLSWGFAVWRIAQPAARPASLRRTPPSANDAVSAPTSRAWSKGSP